jgi:hypothetical protein
MAESEAGEAAVSYPIFPVFLALFIILVAFILCTNFVEDWSSE